MSNTDLIITWIKHADYPIFRKFIYNYGHWFNKIYILFSEHNRFPYFDHFIQSAITHDVQGPGAASNVVFLDSFEYEYGKADWRNVATNAMLTHSSAEWVCSIEQDFFAKNWLKLFEIIDHAQDTYDFFGWMNITARSYIHPAFWFIKRELLEKTGKDFTPHSEIIGSDHFAMITYKAQELGVKIGTQTELGLRCDITTPAETDCFHLGGVNQNYLEGLKMGHAFHRGELFKVYNYYCRLATVTQSPQFTKLSLSIEQVLNERYPVINPIENDWKQFFI